MTEYHDHRDDCPFKFATLDACDCVEKNMLDRIEALTAKLAKAVQFTEGVIRHAGNSGDDYLAEQARVTLAEIKEGRKPRWKMNN